MKKQGQGLFSCDKTGVRDRRHFGRECPVEQGHYDHWKREAKVDSDN